MEPITTTDIDVTPPGDTGQAGGTKINANTNALKDRVNILSTMIRPAVPADLNITTAGTTVIAANSVNVINIGVGSGAYTRKFGLETTNTVLGDSARLLLSFAANASATIEIYPNPGCTGSPLVSYTSETVATAAQMDYAFRTAWIRSGLNAIAGSETVDTTRPTCVVTPNGTTTSSSPITFTLTFSEAVTGLLASEITVTNGTKGSLSGSGSVYTIPVTPSGAGAVTCVVTDGAAQDASSNTNTVSNTASVTYSTGGGTIKSTLSMYAKASDITGVSNGDVVPSWTPEVGSGSYTIASVSGTQPTFSTAGKKSVVFTGTGDLRFNLTAATIAGDFTACASIKSSTGSGCVLGNTTGGPFIGLYFDPAPGVVTADASIDCNSGHPDVSSLVINEGGNYLTAPSVTVGGDGSGATATCTLDTAGHVNGVTFTSLGSGYTSATLTFGEGLDTGNVAMFAGGNWIRIPGVDASALAAGCTLIVTRISNVFKAYQNGTSLGTRSGAGGSLTIDKIGVFGLTNGDLEGNLSGVGFKIGTGLSAGDVATLNTEMHTDSL